MPEIELKFALDPNDRPRFVRAAALAGLRQRRTRLSNIYFDTPALELSAHAMALRLRRAGKRWFQTLKAGASGTGGLHARDEWEYERPGACLDLALFAGTPLAQLEDAAHLHERLAPAFEVEFARTTWNVEPAPGSMLEVALDMGAVAGGGRREAICEVEIECIAGPLEAAFDLAERLLDTVVLRPSAVSKAERGYRLFRGERARPVKAAAVHLEAAMSPAQAARAIVAAALAQLQANEAGVLESSDPEFVHQARVALRRMRSALRMFRDVVGRERAGPWREALGRTAALLGGARDWDVFAGESLREVLAAYGDAALARRLAGRATRARRAARRAARAAVVSEEHARTLLALSRWIAIVEPAEAVAEAPPLLLFAARILRKRHRRVREGADRLPGLSPEERHRVRIDAKRLRYGVDSLASLFPSKRAHRYAASLGRLQDALGRANDAATAARLLPELAPPEPFAAFARGWFAARMQGDPMLLRALAERLARRKRFWPRPQPAGSG